MCGMAITGLNKNGPGAPNGACGELLGAIVAPTMFDAEGGRPKWCA